MVLRNEECIKEAAVRNKWKLTTVKGKYEFLLGGSSNGIKFLSNILVGFPPGRSCWNMFSFSASCWSHFRTVVHTLCFLWAFSESRKRMSAASFFSPFSNGWCAFIILPAFTTTHSDQWRCSLIGIHINFFSKILMLFLVVHDDTDAAPSSSNLEKNWVVKKWYCDWRGSSFRDILRTHMN